MSSDTDEEAPVQPPSEEQQERIQAAMMRTVLETGQPVHSSIGCGACGAYPGAAKLLLCRGCCYVRYCSKACQKSAWKEHKVICLPCD